MKTETKKIEQQLLGEETQAVKKEDAPLTGIITDFNLVPLEKRIKMSAGKYQNVPVMFSEHTVWAIKNKRNGVDTFINGIQADSYIGLNDEIREELEEHLYDTFTVGVYTISFVQYDAKG